MARGKEHFSDYSLLEHEADIGIRGTGDCWGCAFAGAAEALLEVMANPALVGRVRDYKITVRGHDVGALFVSWLNELLFLRDTEGMLFSECDVRIEQDRDGMYALNAVAWGEELSPEKHDLKIEVKAATFSGLRWGEEEGRRFVQCLLDV
jgi:SHS2 domain-containing protein